MTRPWIEINRSYAAKGERGKAMQQLVSAIESSPFAEGLFAWTSMMDLCITQTPVEYPYYGPYLRISPKSENALEFRYVDTWDKRKQWNRMVPADKAFERLQRFFVDLHWFTSTQPM